MDTRRLVGLDVARCLALIGMVSTHVLAERDPDGSLTFIQGLAGGRSAALFAVLAGVSLALMTGRQDPVRGRERAARSLGVAVRALVIAGIGLLLGPLTSGLAVILTYYGVLFLLGLPFLGMRARPLFVLAGVWALLAPVVSYLVQPHLPGRGFGNPTVEQLSDPAQLLSELTFTGYYPVLPWLAYLLAGMGLGRLDLGRRRVQAWIAASGAVLCLGAAFVSHSLTSRDSVIAALLSGDEPLAGTGPELIERISGGMYGNTPVGGPWQWMLVVAPHSTTPFDLVQTIGSSLLVIEACLLVVGDPRPGLDASHRHRLRGRNHDALPVHAARGHAAEVPAPEAPWSYPWHVLTLMGIGAIFVYARRRGPLEWLVATLSARTAALVRAA